MFSPIENYALLGNLRCAALVSRAGSIDWFCPGRFDAPACFSAILGNEQHGRWQISPQTADFQVKRQYQKDTLVLETCFITATGTAYVTDTMPIGACHIVRKVHCRDGFVSLQMCCNPRFGFGKYEPVARAVADAIIFDWQGEKLRLCASISMSCDTANAAAEFELRAGEECWFTLTHAAQDRAMPPVPDVFESLTTCAEWWRAWLSRCQYRGQWDDMVKRSLITLKALTFEPGGGMVAAPTTSLPEVPGGSANYDYRFCWLRDAAFALKVLLNEGYTEEARAWCEWLRKAVEQRDGHLHALYTIAAEITPNVQELEWLPGYQNSKPVRIGNAANHQYQLDVRGELIEVLHLARRHGLALHDDIWTLQCRILEELHSRWREPDTGIWEFRTICDHLTHSKVLAWVAYDRSICDAETYGLYAPLDEWREQREAVRADILQHGVDAKGGYFTQRYGYPDVDASLLMIPLVGFLPADDPRMQATVAKIETELCSAGLVRRYRTGDQASVEGMFIPCSFWLADVYWLAGRHRDARTLFSRLLGLCNDVGLLAEEYDIYKGQQLGNFPQGLSHLALISTARLLATRSEKEAELD